MRPLRFLLLVAALLSPVGLNAQPISDSDRQGIQSTILAQIQAFRQDDAGTAYSYASPYIQEKFQNPGRFMNIVRRNYQHVYRAQDVAFTELSVVEGQPIQQVHLVGPDGTAVIAAYIMQRQEDGSWKINGVHLRKADDTTS